MIRLGKHMERYEIVYRLSADEMVDGIPAHEVAAIIYAFAELVQKTLDETGSDGDLKVNVKPFEEGSFITEFVVTYGSSIINIFTSPESDALANALTILGFVGGGVLGVKSLPNVIRSVKGKINEFKDNGDDTYTYGEGEGAATVDTATHAVVQSPDIARLYKKVSIGPIVGWGNNINVTIQEKSAFQRGETESAAYFTSADEPDMSMYEHTAKNGVPEEREEIESMAHGIALSPKAGPYDGGENGYTFKFDDETTYKYVQMHDLDFRLKLERGEVRFAEKDIVIVDLLSTQSISKSGKTSTSHVITKVIEYRKFEPPQQASIDDIIDE